MLAKLAALMLVTSVCALELPANTNPFSLPDYNHNGLQLCTETLANNTQIKYHFTQDNLRFLIKKIDAVVDPKRGGEWNVVHKLRDYEKIGHHLANLEYALVLQENGYFEQVILSLSTAVSLNLLRDMSGSKLISLAWPRRVWLGACVKCPTDQFFSISKEDSASPNFAFFRLSTALALISSIIRVLCVGQ